MRQQRIPPSQAGSMPRQTREMIYVHHDVHVCCNPLQCMYVPTFFLNPREIAGIINHLNIGASVAICLSPAQLLHSLVYVFMWVGYRPVYDAKTRTWRGIAMVARFLYG